MSYTIPVDQTPVTIGRSPHATICLKEEAVSRQHCVVSPSHGRLTLMDQGSTNGTCVNGDKVKRARLSHGDMVEIGATRIRVQARTDGGSLLGWREDKEAFKAPLLPHEQLALIRRLAARLAISRNEVNAASAIIDVAFEAFPAERTVVVRSRRSAKGGGVDVIVARHRDGSRIQEPEIDDAVIKRVLASGRPERQLAVLTETLPGAEKEQRESSPRHILCAPMRRGSETLGLLYLEAEEMPEWAGSADSLALLSSLTDLAGLALGKGELESAAGKFGEVKIEHSDGQEDLRETMKVELEDHLGGTASDRELDIPSFDHIAHIIGLGEEQRSAIEEIQRNLERRVAERAEVIESQRIELAARLEELEHLQTTRAEMSRGLVHDIRNLVSALMSNLSFVHLGIEQESEEAVALDAATECARRIVAMAEDVLDVSRMEEGTFPLETERVQVRSLAKDVIRNHTAQARECSVILELGDIDAHQCVLADGSVLARVLDNLVDNALRYAGDEGRVLLDLHSGRFSTELVVSDTGPGISPEQRDRIFEEWARGDANRHSRHRGIGLYFCRLAMEAHGGAIRVEGESGDNRFVLSLPTVEEPEARSHTTDKVDVEELDIEK